MSESIRPADVEDLAQVISRLGREDAWRGLHTGELEAVGSSQERSDFAPKALSPAKFQAELKEQILDSCTIDVVDRQPVSRRIVRRRIPVPHRIYIRRASVDRFETALGHNRPRPVETGISAAIKSLWPQGIPRHVRADDRDAQNKQYLVNGKKSKRAAARP